MSCRQVAVIHYWVVNFLPLCKFCHSIPRRQKMYEESENDFDSDFTKYIETNFKRFLDDCFLIFTRTKEQLMKFFNLLNSLYPRIKLTWIKARHTFQFWKHYSQKNGKLQTVIYYKPTDSKQYLLNTSWHPKYT